MTQGMGAGVYGNSLGRRLRISLENMLHFFRLRYMLSWPVLMKFKQTLGQRNKLVFALIVSGQVAMKAFRLPTQLLHWYDNAKRCRIILIPNTQRYCIGFLDMLGCKEIKSLTGLQGTVVFRNLSDLSCLWGFLH
jgi:hypothetical protein